MSNENSYSPEWYRRHAYRYAEVAETFIQSVYHDASHPALRDDNDILARTRELAPGIRGLDAGCGAGARDVATMAASGYDMWGVDAIDENIALGRQRHPELAERLAVHDLHVPLPFDDGAFDVVLCNSVIQHIDPASVYGTVLPELCRVLRPGGVLCLHFKQGDGQGDGVWTVFDKDYGAERSFRLYDAQEVLAALQGHGMALVEATGDALGGIVYARDPKDSPDCFMWLRKGLA